jgi:hypothetical protein
MESDLTRWNNSQQVSASPASLGPNLPNGYDVMNGSFRWLTKKRDKANGGIAGVLCPTDHPTRSGISHVSTGTTD